MKIRNNNPGRQALLVGDHFLHFAEKHEDVFTVTGFRSRFDADSNPYAFLYCGQGFSPRQHEWFARVTGGRSGEVVSYPKLASSRESHKHEEGNIMVSVPRKSGDGEFEVDLLISSKAAEISDHQTGEHLSGASLEEAARQSLLVVTEHFFIPVGESGDYYFVTRGKHVDFQYFAFPLPTILRYAIVGFEADEKRNVLSFDVRITFEQARRSVAAIRFSFAVYRKSWLARKEHALAAEALDVLFGRAAEAPAIGEGGGEERGTLPKATDRVGAGEGRVEGGQS